MIKGIFKKMVCLACDRKDPGGKERGGGGDQMLYHSSMWGRYIH